MENLIGKSVIFMVTIGLLSSGIAKCSLDIGMGAKFIRGVGSAALGTNNSELQDCQYGVCLNTYSRPTQPVQPSPR